jgi:hypothetical protein
VAPCFRQTSSSAIASKGNGFRLAHIDPGDKNGLDLDKDAGNALLAEGAKRLGELQEELYAEQQWAILVICKGSMRREKTA